MSSQTRIGANISSFSKHRVICLDPKLLTAPNTGGMNSVTEIRDEYEKQKKQIISSYERQVQRLLGQLSVALKQIEFLENYRSTVNNKQNNNNNNNNNNRYSISNSQTNSHSSSNSHHYLTNNGSWSSTSMSASTNSNNSASNNNNNSNDLLNNEYLREFNHNAEAYIDQMNRKIQYMNEEMINMRNLYNTKIDYITNEFENRFNKQEKEITHLKHQLITQQQQQQQEPQQPNLSAPNSNTNNDNNSNYYNNTSYNKKRDSIDELFDGHSRNNTASLLKFEAIPSFQMKQTTMTPSPVGSDDENENEAKLNSNNDGSNSSNSSSDGSNNNNEEEDRAALEVLKLSSDGFHSWSARPQTKLQSRSVMTPSPPDSPRGNRENIDASIKEQEKLGKKLMAKGKKQKLKEKRKKEKHTGKMDSIPELDSEAAKAISKEKERERLKEEERATFDMVKQLGTFGNDDDDDDDSSDDNNNNGDNEDSSDIDSEEERIAKQELIGNRSAFASVSHGHMTPSPTKEGIYQFGNENGMNNNNDNNNNNNNNNNNEDEYDDYAVDMDEDEVDQNMEF